LIVRGADSETPWLRERVGTALLRSAVDHERSGRWDDALASLERLVADFADDLPAARVAPPGMSSRGCCGMPDGPWKASSPTGDDRERPR